MPLRCDKHCQAKSIAPANRLSSYPVVHLATKNGDAMTEGLFAYDIPVGEDADTLGRKINRIWAERESELRAVMQQNGISGMQVSEVALADPFLLKEAGGGITGESIALLVSLAPLIHVLTPLLQPFSNNAADVAKKIALDCWEITRRNLWESDQIALLEKKN